MLTISMPDISKALNRATKSKPAETIVLIKLTNDTIKVYSSDKVLIAYVKPDKKEN